MAGMTVAELVARLRADTSDFGRGMRRAESDLMRMDRTVSVVSGGMARMGQVANSVLAGITVAAGAAITSLGAVGVSYNTLMQRTTAAFTVLLGSAENANKMVGELTEFARSSPFPRQLFIAGAQQLIGFGLAAQRVVPAFQAIQDAVAAVGGTAEDISQFTNIFARIQSLGHANSEELMRFSMVGIDAFKLLAETAGTSVEEMRKRVHDGALGSNEAIALLTTGLEQKFSGAAAKVKETWVGAKDRIAGAWRDIGSKLIAPFINPTGGGAAVKWANQFADLLRKLEREVVKPLSDRLTAFFAKIQEQTDKINLDQWLQRGVDLWNKYQDVLRQLLPVLGLVSLSFAKQGLAMLPLIGNFADFLPIPGKLTMALIGLVLANKELREKVIALASSIGERIQPVLEDFGEALLGAGKQVGALIAAIAPGVITQLADALISLIEAGTILVPILADIVSVGLIAISQVLPPVIGLIAQMAKWAAQLVDWLGPLGGLLVFLGLAMIDLPGPLGLINVGFEQMLKVVPKLWGFLGAHPFIALGAAIVYFTTRALGGFDGVTKAAHDVGNAFMVLPRIVGGALQAVLTTVTSFAEAINEGLHRALNPFMRHSPSLVDQVVAGTELIAEKYKGLALDIIPSMRTVEAAMQSLNATAAGAEFRFDAKQNAEVAEQLRLLGGGGLLSAYLAVTAAIARLKNDMTPLVAAYQQENALLAQQQKSLAGLNRQYREHQIVMRVTQRAVSDTTRVVDGITKKIDDARTKIQELLSAPLRGSGAFSDAQFANEQAIAALQYRLNKLKLGDGPIDEIAELEAKIDRLRTVGEQLNLEKQLTVGAQQHQLEKLANTVDEIDFGDAAKEIAKAATEIKDLTKQLMPAQDELDRLQAILEGQERVAETWERAIEDASVGVERQTEVVEELGQTLGGIQQIIDEFSRRQDEITSKAAQNWSDYLAAVRAAKAEKAPLPIEPTIPHDVAGMGDANAAGLGTLLDGLQKSMNEFDTSGFTSKFEQMGRTIGNVVQGITDGFMLMVGARGLGMVASKAAGWFAGGLFPMLGQFGTLLGRVGTVLTGPAGLVGVIIGTGVAMSTMSRNGDHAAEAVDRFTRSLPAATTFERLSSNFNAMNSEYESAKDTSSGFFNDLKAAAENTLPFVANGTDQARQEALLYEQQLGDMQTTIANVSTIAKQLAFAFGDNATAIADLGLKMGLDFVNDVEGSKAALVGTIEQLNQMGMTAQDTKGMTLDMLNSIVEGSRNFRAGMEQNMKQSTSLLGTLGQSSELSAEEVAAQLQTMVDEANSWADNMEYLAAAGPGQGITLAMLEELALAGPKGNALAQQMVEMVKNGTMTGISNQQAALEGAWTRVANLVDKVRPIYAGHGYNAGQAYLNSVIGAFSNPGNINAMLSWARYYSDIMSGEMIKQMSKNLAQGLMLPGLGGRPSRVPVTAVGGIFNGAQMRIIGEAGPEAVLPLNDFARSMQLLAQSGMLPRIANALFASVAGSPLASGGMGLPSGAMPGASSSAAPTRSGDTIVQVTVQGNVTSERNLVEAIHAALLAKGKRNNGQVYFERVAV